MSYAESQNLGTDWVQLKLTESQVEEQTRLYGSTDEQKAELGYYVEVYPVLGVCDSGYSDEPILSANKAVYSAIQLSQEECDNIKKSTYDYELRSQVPIVTVNGTIEDSKLQDETAILILQRDAALQVLYDPSTDLDNFDSNIKSYTPDNAVYAENLALQETANVTMNDELVAQGLDPAFTTSELTEMNSRIIANEGIAKSGTGTPVTPQIQELEYGTPRSYLALANEDKVRAEIKEVSFSWNGTDYYIPQTTLEYIPSSVNSSLLYSMIYLDDGSEEGSYVGWLPFIQDPDTGKWITPANTSYISIAKTTKGGWRVSVNNGHESAPYRITRKIYLGVDGIKYPILRFDAVQ